MILNPGISDMPNEEFYIIKKEIKQIIDDKQYSLI